jgi:RNA polymerase sigma factor (sigma-70 family)
MADVGTLANDLHETRERFLALVAEIRPDLHRYCARMTGSVTDGEDIVQETLARAYYALPELYDLPPLRAWLFQIAHNRAIDHLRRYEARMSRPLDAIGDPLDLTDNPEDALARSEAVSAAVTAFVHLPPVPRSCVILKDILGHSLDEICTLLGLGLPAVKAALHRGRMQLRTGTSAPPGERPTRAPSATVAKYAALFDARDWEGVRALLAEDVRLDLVSRSQRIGRRAVGGYLSNYDALPGWRLGRAWLGAREVLAVFPDPASPAAAYFIEVVDDDAGQIVSIRDYRYVPYILRDAAIVLEEGPGWKR